jgi:DNA polymerase III subunit gamma/tau
MAHAYLFCGPRGTGKTTAAKILARAMNCEHYPVSEPCGRCVPCKNIAAGVSIDVIEMDAASNRGIDEIRELRERSRFASGESRFKIYIIDEAHMLTTEACNAFLKTLEEPPRNVVFILATTDPSRLPSTIVSRCQRFDFHLITMEQIRQRLEQILEFEGWQAEKEAISLISRLAEGSLRDALGILEQCSAYSEDQITAEQVREVTGSARTETIGTLVEAAVNNEIGSGLAVIEQVVYGGIDLNLFFRDLTFVFTRLLLESEGRDKSFQSNLFGFEELVSIYRGRIDRKTLLDAVEHFHEVGLELRHAHFPQYILEVAFIRLVRLLHGRYEPVTAIDAKPVSDQAVAVDDTELPVKEKNGKRPASAVKDEAIENNLSQPSEPVESAGMGTVRVDKGKDHRPLLQESWPRLLQSIKRKQKSTAAWLEPALVGECQGSLVRLAYTREYSIHQIRIMEDNHRKLVESELSGFLGSPVTVKAVIVEGDSPVPDECAAADSTGLAGKQNSEEAGKKKTTGITEAMEIFGGEIIDTD